MKKFYAVQVGQDYSCDNGSTAKRKAVSMARQEAKENPGKQVRLAECWLTGVDDDFPVNVTIIQDGES